MTTTNQKIIELVKKIIILLSILFFTFLISLTLRSNPFSQYLPNHDSSMFQYFGYAMNNGKTVYTEIFDHKGPMIFILNYFGIMLSTQNIQGIYLIEFASLFIYFLYSYKTIRLWLGRVLSLTLLVPQGIILMYFLEGGNLTEEFALPFIAVSLYIFSKYFIDTELVNHIEITFLGFASALVFSLRANMVVLWLVFCFIILFKLLLKKENKKIISYIVFFTAGLLLFFIPIGLYLYLNGALEEAIFQSLTFNFMYLDTSGNQSEAVMQLYSHLNNHHIIFLIGAFMFYVATEWRKLDDNNRYLFMSLMLFAVGSYFISIMSGRDYQHYLMAMIPTVTVPSAIIFKKLSKEQNKYLVVSATLILFSLIYYPQISRKIDDIYVLNTPVQYVKAQEDNQDETNRNEKMQKLNQKILNNAAEKEETIEIANIIKENSNPNDEIYAHKLAGNLYLLSERLCSIKYFNLPAVNINENLIIGEDFLQDFIQSDTEIVVLKNNFNNADKTGKEEKFFNYVVANYDLVYDQNNHYIYKLSPE